MGRHEFIEIQSRSATAEKPHLLDDILGNFDLQLQMQVVERRLTKRPRLELEIEVVEVRKFRQSERRRAQPGFLNIGCGVIPSIQEVHPQADVSKLEP